MLLANELNCTLESVPPSTEPGRKRTWKDPEPLDPALITVPICTLMLGATGSTLVGLPVTGSYQITSSSAQVCPKAVPLVVMPRTTPKAVTRPKSLSAKDSVATPIMSFTFVIPAIVGAKVITPLAPTVPV